MFKKIELWVVLIILIFFFVITIFFGAIIDYSYSGGKKFAKIQKISIFLAQLPKNLKFILKDGGVNTVSPTSSKLHVNKNRFNKYIDEDLREELILISRHDGDLKRSVVELIDINTFEVLHTFLPDINKINSKTDTSREEFKYLNRDHSEKRHYMMHPAITSKGELIFKSASPLVKIDFCSNLIWINDENNYHHSTEIDDEGNIYVPSHIFPFEVSEKIVGKNFDNYLDDGITILNTNGKVLFSKSVSQILIENGYLNRLFALQKFLNDPIHLNDIQPVLNDGKFWKKGDLFISIRNISMIFLYRPETNKIIKILENEVMLNQHDVDIIDEKSISFFNNNFVFGVDKRVKNGPNEIIIYDFENDTYTKKFKEQIDLTDPMTQSQGLHTILKDGSLHLEESNSGRILFFNSEGKLVWEFINKSSKNEVYDLWWSRVIEDKKLILSLKKLLDEKKCLN